MTDQKFDLNTSCHPIIICILTNFRSENEAPLQNSSCTVEGYFNFKLEILFQIKKKKITK